ncbi:MAG: glycerol-3-phosphate 1-O-acyltransferase PlsY [Deltaproteobacteria bacterium]|nr:MAG: glycerol-3-phosphate 1-O-acyltransferase PlsY [Deltaproteobacteria bacterium]
MWTVIIILLIGAYLLGSIPFGVIISRAVIRLDITKVGSGNIGATNVAREVGLKWGVITLVADALKGYIPVALAQYMFGSSTETTEGLAGIVGVLALLGHQYPIYNRFKGGKGIATGLGILLALSPISCLFSGIIFVVVVTLWGYVSLGSILAALTVPLWLYIVGHSTFLILLSLIMSLLITFRHRGNIQRLLRGNERKWHKGGYLNRSTKRPRSSSE